jgi:6-phosphogluconolactonase
MMVQRAIQVYATLDDLVLAGVALWREMSRAAVAAHGCFRVALAGGSTPKRLYAALAKEHGIPWESTWVFWGDERYVPPDHPDSNAGMAQAALLNHVPIPKKQIFPWPTHSGDPWLDAAAYAATLRHVFGDSPTWDLLLLGMGDDGHTASLFPGTAAVQVQNTWTTVGEKGGDPRLTLTFAALNAARCAVIWVAGSGKAKRVQEVLSQAVGLPIQGIKPQGSLIWMLDGEAAAALPWV